MSQLLKLYEPITINYEKFLADSSKINLLKKNIELFNALDADELKKSLNKYSAHDLEVANEVLLIMAKSYTKYALATSDSNSLMYLQEANRCYRNITIYIGKLPSRSLTTQLGKQNSEAEFYKHQIQFEKAKLELFFLLKAQQVEPKAVEKIINDCKKFNAILQSSYKNPILQMHIAIDTAALLQSVNEQIEEAQSLLNNNTVTTRKRKSLHTDGATSTPKKSPNKEKLHAKKVKRTPGIEIQPLEEELEEPLSQLSDEPAITTTLPKNDLTTLATAALATHSFFYTTTSQNTAVKNSTNTVNDTPVQHVKDSETCNLWVSRIEAQNSKSHALEMLGFALLNAATSLQTNSLVFGNQKTNPAIQFAVKFLLRSVDNTTNPSESLRQLSYHYANYLKPYTTCSLFELSPEFYLEHLRLRISKDQKIPGFHGLNTKQMIDCLFETLASICSTTDYECIKQSCLQSLQSSANTPPENKVNDTQYTI